MQSVPVRIAAMIDDAALTRHCSKRSGTPQLDETGGAEEEQKYSSSESHMPGKAREVKANHRVGLQGSLVLAR